ncbi:MAG: peptide ABC transporter permease, partial [Devosia sp.]
MFQFILRRLALLVPTLIGITICTFGFVRLIPVDPILALAGERGVSAKRYAELVIKYGFDRPVWEQYFIYLGQLLRGDLGNSLVSHRAIITDFLTFFP